MDVSVVVLSFNTKDLLKNCLDSIFKFTKDVEFEVIVVDNASTDGSVEYIQGIKDKAKTIFSKENLGFSKGNNLGIKEAKGKYVLLLNPDTVLTENSVKVMKDWMDVHQDCAVSSCQLLDSEQQVSPTGGYAPTLFRVAMWALFLDDLPFISKIFHSYHPHSVKVPWTEFFKDIPGLGFFLKPGIAKPEVAPVYQYDKEFFPDWVTGAFFFMRKSVIDQIGALDEGIFLYGEELEWCLRAQKSGLKIGYTPATHIMHLERKSSGGLPSNAILGEYKGLKYIYGKYELVWKQLVLGSFLDIGAFLRMIFWAVRLKPAMVKIYYQALLL